VCCLHLHSHNVQNGSLSADAVLHTQAPCSGFPSQRQSVVHQCAHAACDLHTDLENMGSDLGWGEEQGSGSDEGPEEEEEDEHLDMEPVQVGVCVCRVVLQPAGST
jgi:hypothetical protein